jgi:hypothetical protein
MLRNPELRDPRGYILPSDQPDFATATKFVNALLKVGVTVHRSSAPFTAAGKGYPAGSFVVKAAQAFRPHVLDMFEPQDHPDDIPYPGGPPTRPYDNAGWTLAYQMGVKFDRVMDKIDGTFETVQGLQKAPPGTVSGTATAGYVQPRDERCFHRHQPVGEGAKTSPGDGRTATGRSSSPPSRDAGGGDQDRERPRRQLPGVAARPGPAIKLHKMRIALADSMAARCRRAGRASCSSSSSSRSRSSIRRRSMPAISRERDVIVFPSGVGPASLDAGGRGRRGGGGAAAAAGGGAGAAPESRPNTCPWSAATGGAVDPGPEAVRRGGRHHRRGRPVGSQHGGDLRPAREQPPRRARPDGVSRQVPTESSTCRASVLSAAIDPSLPIAQG